MLELLILKGTVEALREQLEKQFKGLIHFKSFMNNHNNHEVNLYSFSEDKGVETKLNVSKKAMKKIVKIIEKDLVNAKDKTNELQLKLEEKMNANNKR